MNTNSQSLNTIRFLVIDIDGVLWHGRQPLPGVPAFFEFMKQHGIGFVIATNNSARPTSEIIDRVARLGTTIDDSQILTSAEATAMYLPRLVSRGGRVLLIGGEGIASALAQAGYQLVERDADVVVVGVDFNLTYEKLKRATLEIRRGARFVGTNSDKTFPGDEGLTPGAGSILAALQAATDVNPIIIGKPERAMFELALEKMGASRDSTAMLGDRLDTDIEGAQNAGLKAILVLTGVTSRESLAQSAIQPDFLFENLVDLRAAWERELQTY